MWNSCSACDCKQLEQYMASLPRLSVSAAAQKLDEKSVLYASRRLRSTSASTFPTEAQASVTAARRVSRLIVRAGPRCGVRPVWS